MTNDAPSEPPDLAGGHTTVSEEVVNELTDQSADERADGRTSRALMAREYVRRLLSFAVGAAAGTLVLLLVVEAVPFLSTFTLGALVVLTGLVALLPGGRHFLKVGLAATALLSVLILFTPLMEWSVDALDVSVPPRRADVIVVLGAGIHCGTGNLDATSVARTTKGVALWKAGFAPVITVSDGDRSILGTCPSQAQVTIDLIESMLGQNTPPIVVLRHMRTTRTEANAVASMQNARNWKTVMVVTSPTHTRRALDTFRKAGVNAFVVAADEPNFDRAFDHPVDRLRALAPVFRELAAAVKYRLSP